MLKQTFRCSVSISSSHSPPFFPSTPFIPHLSFSYPDPNSSSSFFFPFLFSTPKHPSNAETYVQGELIYQLVPGESSTYWTHNCPYQGMHTALRTDVVYVWSNRRLLGTGNPVVLPSPCNSRTGEEGGHVHGGLKKESANDTASLSTARSAWMPRMDTYSSEHGMLSFFLSKGTRINSASQQVSQCLYMHSG